MGVRGTWIGILGLEGMKTDRKRKEGELVIGDQWCICILQHESSVEGPFYAITPRYAM